METLYGHQDSILSIDSLDKERAVTCGGRDRSLRLWKVVEESQLIFQGVTELESVDCLSMITEAFYVCGCANGTLGLWDIQKKKTVQTVELAHGNGKGITAINALRFGDVVATGSSDGFLRVWKCMPKKRHISKLFEIPLVRTPVYVCFDITHLVVCAPVACLISMYTCALVACYLFLSHSRCLFLVYHGALFRIMKGLRSFLASWFYLNRMCCTQRS